MRQESYVETSYKLRFTLAHRDTGTLMSRVCPHGATRFSSGYDLRIHTADTQTSSQSVLRNTHAHSTRHIKNKNTEGVHTRTPRRHETERP